MFKKCWCLNPEASGRAGCVVFDVVEFLMPLLGKAVQSSEIPKLRFADLKTLNSA